MQHFLISVLIWILLSVFRGATKDFNHVGCFNTSSVVHYNHETDVQPFTWEVCHHLCHNMVTMHAGIQLSKHRCFCTNNVPQGSAEVDRSHCQPCQEDSAHWCGGDDTLSLYQLKPTGSSPLGVLLATDGGIRMVITDNKSNSSETLKLSNTSATSVAYHYKNQQIYFISENKVMRLPYMPLSLKSIHPLVIIEKDCSDLSDLELDWEINVIYFACPRRATILKAGLEGTLRGKGVIEWLVNATELQYLAVEPYARFVLFTRRNALSWYDFRTFKEGIVHKKYHFINVSRLAIDIQQEVIYMIGFYSDNDKRHLVSLSYDYTVFKKIYRGDALSNPCGLDAFNGTIFWCSVVDDKNYKLYRGNISPKGHLEKVTEIFTGTQKINDMKVYHPAAQSPSADHLCRKKNCSDGCSVASSGLVQCSCPLSTVTNFTSVLANDSRTCIDVPNNRTTDQPISTTDRPTSTTDRPTSTTDRPTSTTDRPTSTTDRPTSTTDRPPLTTESVTSLTEVLTSSTKYPSTDYTTGNEYLENRSKTEESSTVATIVPSEHYTPRTTQSSKEIPNQETTSHLLYIISCGFILILVVVIPLQVYLVVSIRRTNNVVTPLVSYHKPSDLVELVHNL